MTEYGWDEFIFDGEPLKSDVQDILDTTGDVLAFVSALLEAQAAALRLLADIIDLFDNPLDSVVFEVLLELINALLAMFGGRFNALFITPRNFNDKFGPEGFVSRVNETYDDIGDPHRPIIDDFDGNSTIEGGATTGIGNSSISVGDWQGFVDGVYTKVLAGSVNISSLSDGFYIITIEDEQFNAVSLGAVAGAPISNFSTIPPPLNEVTEYVNEVTEFIESLSDRTNATRYSTISDFIFEFPYLSFVFVENGEVTVILDARLYTPTVAMLVLYFNDANIIELAKKVIGLGIFFKQGVERFAVLAEAIENYVPREEENIVDTRRRAGRPPNWWSPAIEFFILLENALKSLMVQVEPPSSSSDYLNLVADFVDEQALFLASLGQTLQDLADLLEAAVFTAARMWVPLSYGGTDFLKNIMTATIQQLTDQLAEDYVAEDYDVSEYENTFYSFGVVLVGDSLSIPAMALIGGVDLTGGTGTLPDLVPNIVYVDGTKIEIITP